MRREPTLLCKANHKDGKKLAENDDIDPRNKNRNSRLMFQPKQTGTYHLIATSYQQRGRGAYDIIIHEFQSAASPAQKAPANKPPGAPMAKTQVACQMPGAALVRMIWQSRVEAFRDGSDGMKTGLVAGLAVVAVWKWESSSDKPTKLAIVYKNMLL